MSQARPTLFIIGNSIFPYGYDAIKILGLPNGARFRARFAGTFVSEQIRNEFHLVRETEGHYCFRDYETNYIVPLRRILIRKIEQIGDIYYISYTVKNLYPFPSNQDLLRNQVNSWNAQLRTVMKFSEDAPGADLKPLVFFSQNNPNFDDETKSLAPAYNTELRHWASIANFLGDYSYFCFIPFLKIVSVTKFGSLRTKVFTDNHPLKTDNDYELTVAHSLRSDSKIPHSINKERTDREQQFKSRASYRLELTADQRYITATAPVVTMTGSYDVNSFIIHVRQNQRLSSTCIFLDYIRKPIEMADVDTEMRLRVRVQPSFLRFGVLVVLLSVFAGVYFTANFAPSIIKALHLPHFLAADIAIVALAVTIVDLLNEIRRIVARP